MKDFKSIHIDLEENIFTINGKDVSDENIKKLNLLFSNGVYVLEATSELMGFPDKDELIRKENIRIQVDGSVIAEKVRLLIEDNKSLSEVAETLSTKNSMKHVTVAKDDDELIASISMQDGELVGIVQNGYKVSADGVPLLKQVNKGMSGYQKDSKLVEFQELTKPLVEWLQKNGNPHQTIVITQIQAKLVSDELGVPFNVSD